MHVVYKYELPPSRDFKLSLPQDAEILSLDFQEGAVLWARVNPDNPRVLRSFILIMTGEPREELAKLSTVHRGTVQKVLDDQFLVFHLFELI